MKGILLLTLAMALEAGFLLTLAVPVRPAAAIAPPAAVAHVTAVRPRRS
jgi:hypothetical protein